MTALTNGRPTKERSNDLIAAPVAGGAKIIQGGIAVLNNTGNAVAGFLRNDLITLGVARDTVDNTDGNDGDRIVEARKGCFAFENSTAGDLITRLDIGSNAYIIDDQTVAKTDGGGARSSAGRIIDVDADGVWIEFK